MRISVCFLYADIYDRFDAEMQEKIRKKIIKLAKDDTPMVRRGAAQALPIIAKKLQKKHAQEFLIPVINDLLQDPNDSVKINAVKSSIDVAQAVNDSKLVEENILSAF